MDNRFVQAHKEARWALWLTLLYLAAWLAAAYLPDTRVGITGLRDTCRCCIVNQFPATGTVIRIGRLIEPSRTWLLAGAPVAVASTLTFQLWVWCHLLPSLISFFDYITSGSWLLPFFIGK